MVERHPNQQRIPGLSRLIVYSYLERNELMGSIRVLSKKDRERVDTSYIIREGKGEFSAKVDLR